MCSSPPKNNTGYWRSRRSRQNITTAFLREGNNVAVCDVDEIRLSQTASDWSAHGERALVPRTDITDERTVEDLIRDKFGRLDMLINSAGVNTDRIMGINLTGTLFKAKVAVALVESQPRPGGTIINIGSVASYKGFNAGAAYNGTYNVALLLGGMDDTNIADHIKKGALNKDGMTRIEMANPGYVPGKTNIPLADVAKYCIFFSDPNMTAASNGAAINVH
ncbi:hypothetical protein BDV06DRAFT_215155 [Aspergillus oleicola]